MVAHGQGAFFPLPDHDFDVVVHGCYLSARWPGDAYVIAKKLIAKLATVRTRAMA